MAGLWRNVFSSSSRLVRVAAASSTAGIWPGAAASIARRHVATGSVLRAGVDPVEEAVFTPDHVEMRDVSTRTVCVLVFTRSFQALNKFIEKEINPYVDEWEKAKAFPAHEVHVYISPSFALLRLIICSRVCLWSLVVQEARLCRLPGCEQGPGVWRPGAGLQL